MIYAAKTDEGFYRWFDTDTGFGGYVDDLSWLENMRVLESESSIDELEEAAQQK